MQPRRSQHWVSTSLVAGLLLTGVTGFDYCAVPCTTKTQTYKHTMCLYPKETPAPLCKNLDSSKELKEEDKQLLLKLHNQLRSKVAEGKEPKGSPGPQPPAANMMELVWDKELEIIARRWALQCDYKHDRCRQTKNKEFVGQNLAVSYESTGFQNDLEKMVNGWYDEVEFAPNKVARTFSSSAGKDGEVIGHYTQLVWGETSRVGCARVFFDFSDWGMTEYLVCNYGKGGNLRNAPMYAVGEHCTACGSGLKCSSTYPGLCRSDEDLKDTADYVESDDLGTEPTTVGTEPDEGATGAEDDEEAGLNRAAQGAVGTLEMSLHSVLVILVVKFF